jgi:hypothetical protein
VKGGSPWRAGDGEGAGSDVDDDGSSDKWSPMVKKWMQAVYEVVWSCLKRWWGHGCMNGGWRR